MARRKVMTVQLPPTTCTPELRARVVAEADRRGVSIADIVRDALTVFLPINVSISDTGVGKYNQENQQ